MPLRAIFTMLAFTGLLPLVASAADYEIDASHSNVTFKVRHLGISTVAGSFGEFTGKVSFDPKNIAASSTEATITAKSVDTKNPKRDDHLKSGDFLETEKHPELTFKSKRIFDVIDNSFKVEGDLTLHGVTKTVVLEATFDGLAVDPWGNERVGFTATTAIDRKDYGVSWSKVMDNGGLVVGNEVKIELAIEAMRKV